MKFCFLALSFYLINLLCLVSTLLLAFLKFFTSTYGLCVYACLRDLSFTSVVLIPKFMFSCPCPHALDNNNRKIKEAVAFCSFQVFLFFFFKSLVALEYLPLGSLFLVLVDIRIKPWFFGGNLSPQSFDD